MNITPKRKQILDALRLCHGALSARELGARLPDMDQATIYRNLDAFVSENLVKKFVFEGTESVYEFAHENHHHAVCTDCDRVIHFKAPDAQILDVLGIADFDVESLEVVVRGKCKK